MSTVKMSEVKPVVDIEKLRHPIGRVETKNEYSFEEIQKNIEIIENFPDKLRQTVKGIKKDQLESTYRDGAWNVRQLVHHIFDSHVNAYIRCKLALTEDNPTIKPYNERLWSNLEDSKLPILVSITLLINLHRRWTVLLRSLKEDDFKRTFFHPEYNSTVTLGQLVNIYAWHGNHHLAHIQIAMKKKK